MGQGLAPRHKCCHAARRQGCATPQAHGTPRYHRVRTPRLCPSPDPNIPTQASHPMLSSRPLPTALSTLQPRLPETPPRYIPGSARLPQALPRPPPAPPGLPPTPFEAPTTPNPSPRPPPRPGPNTPSPNSPPGPSLPGHPRVLPASPGRPGPPPSRPAPAVGRTQQARPCGLPRTETPARPCGLPRPRPRPGPATYLEPRPRPGLAAPPPPPRALSPLRTGEGRGGAERGCRERRNRSQRRNREAEAEGLRGCTGTNPLPTPPSASHPAGGIGARGCTPWRYQETGAPPLSLL